MSKRQLFNIATKHLILNFYKSDLLIRMYKCIKVQEIESALCCLPSIPGQCNEWLIREGEKKKEKSLLVSGPWRNQAQLWKLTKQGDNQVQRKTNILLFTHQRRRNCCVSCLQPPSRVPKPSQPEAKPWILMLHIRADGTAHPKWFPRFRVWAVKDVTRHKQSSPPPIHR